MTSPLPMLLLTALLLALPAASRARAAPAFAGPGPEAERGAVGPEPGPRPAEPRFVFIPDGAGRLHLVDLWEEETEPLPRFDGAKDVELRLYTRNNPTTAEILRLGDSSSAPSFNPSNPTRFMIHGWNSEASHMDHVRAAYFATGGNYNVVLVDWSERASELYPSAKSDTRPLGEYLAQVVQELANKRGLSLASLALVGHSLGAHAAGVAGNRLGGAVARVVGLDAAAPLFGSTALPDRLDKSDARMVQAIHTDAGGLGWADPLGHADFYPNGGRSQPGCGLDLGGACSHSRSHEYFAESITSTRFVGTRCDSYSAYEQGSCSGNPKAVMGENAPTSASESYYLKTNSKSPFAQG